MAGADVESGGQGNIPISSLDIDSEYYDLFKKIKYETSIKNGRTQILRPQTDIHGSSNGPYRYVTNNNRIE